VMRAPLAFSRCLWRDPLSDPDRADGDPHELYFQAADSGRGEFVRLVFEEARGGSEADAAPERSEGTHSVKGAPTIDRQGNPSHE
jgi:hypothetical protein